MTTITIAGPDGITNVYLAGDVETVSIGLLCASRSRCEADIFALAPDHKQRNAALGILEPAETAAIVAHIVACRFQQNAYEAAVLALRDSTELTTAARVAAMAAVIY